MSRWVNMDIEREIDLTSYDDGFPPVSWGFVKFSEDFEFQVDASTLLDSIDLCVRNKYSVICQQTDVALFKLYVGLLLHSVIILAHFQDLSSQVHWRRTCRTRLSSA